MSTYTLPLNAVGSAVPLKEPENPTSTSHFDTYTATSSAPTGAKEGYAVRGHSRLLLIHDATISGAGTAATVIVRGYYPHLAGWFIIETVSLANPGTSTTGIAEYSSMGATRVHYHLSVKPTQFTSLKLAFMGIPELSEI